MPSLFKELAVSLPNLLRGRTPGQLIIQTTDHCNAGCPQCGMRTQEKFDRSRLDKSRIKRMLDRAAENRVRAVSFTGGEPFLFQDDLFECIAYARDRGIPFIRTGTNGFMFIGTGKPGFAGRMIQFGSRLKESGLYTFWISLDSWDMLEHETGRRLKGVTDGIRQALPVLKQVGVYPSANLGINRTLVREDISVDADSTEEEKFRFYDLYRKAFGRFYDMACAMGFTIANACYPMSAESGSVYKAESSDRIVSYTGTEKYLLFKALYDTIPFYRGKIRIFTPRSSLLTLIRQYEKGVKSGFACYGGLDYFFVNSSDGHAYPCGFRAQDDLGDYETLDIKSIKEKPYCRECDWECLRDPSNQSGPLVEFFRNPFRTAYKMTADWRFTRDWFTDILYQRSCGMFNFSTAPDYRKMESHSKKLIK